MQNSRDRQGNPQGTPSGGRALLIIPIASHIATGGQQRARPQGLENAQHLESLQILVQPQPQLHSQAQGDAQVQNQVIVQLQPQGEVRAEI